MRTHQLSLVVEDETCDHIRQPYSNNDSDEANNSISQNSVIFLTVIDRCVVKCYVTVFVPLLRLNCEKKVYPKYTRLCWM